jgi:hypothetical protein
MLVALANAFSEHSINVVRYDLSFRQSRPKGPPRPGDAERDRAGLREEILKLRAKDSENVWLGGQSYGGRQASMLASEEPGLADGLLLLSYPLHAPGKTQQRTAHFPQLKTPAMFVHGSRDPFATEDELRAAIQLIAAPTALLEEQGVGHDLGRNHAALAPKIVEAFLKFSNHRSAGR